MAEDHNQGWAPLPAYNRKCFAPKARVKVPAVLSVNEVSGLLAALEGPTAVLGRLLYRMEMRLLEAFRLRVRDVDFDRHEIVVRQGKGDSEDG